MVVRELITLLGFKLDDGPQKKYDKQIDATKAKSNGLATAARGIGSAYTWVAGAVAVGVGWITKNILDVSAETERYRVVLGTMIGDQEKANQIIHDLDYSPVSDFYGTANAIGGLQGMVTFGMQAEEASETLTRLADIAQGNSAAFVSMSQNMGQVFAKGKADSTDLKQFVMQGFDVVGEVAKQTGKSRAEIEKAGVTYAQTAAALKALTSEGGKYHGMLAKQMDTLSGIGNQFRSMFAATGEAIGTSILKPLKDVLRYVLNLARSFQDTIVSAASKAFDYLIHVIAQTIISFKILEYRLEKYGGAFTALKNIFQDVFGFLESVIQSAEPFLMNLSVLFVTAFRPIQAFVRPVLEALKPIFQDIFNFAAEVVGKLIPIVDGLTPAFKIMGERIGQILDKLRPVLRNIEKAIIAAFEPIKAFVTPVIEALKPVVEGVFNFINDVLGTAKNKTDGLAGAVRGLTPLFSGLGQFVGSLIRIMGGMIGPILWVTGAIKGIQLGIAGFGKVKETIGTVKTAISTVGDTIKAVQMSGLKGIGLNWSAESGNKLSQFLVDARDGFDTLKDKVINAGGVLKDIGGKIAGVTRALIDNAAAALRAAGAWVVNTAKVVAHKVATLALAAAEKAKAIASKIAAAAQWLLNAAMSANPIGLIIIAVAALIAIIVLLVKNWDKVKDVFLAVGNVIKTVFQSIWNVIKAVFSAVWNYIKAIVSGIVNIIGGILNVVKAVFMAVWNIVTGIFSNMVNTIKNIFGGLKEIWQGDGNFFVKIWESIKLIFSQIWQGILANIKTVANAFLGIWEAVKGLFVRVWESVSNIFKTLWQGIVNIFSTYVEGIKNIFASIINVFAIIWNKIKDGVMAFVNSVVAIWIKFVNGLKSVMSKLADAVKRVWMAISGFFSGFWNSIKAVAIKAWNSLLAFIRTLVEKFKQIWQAVAGFFASLWEGIVSVAKSVWNTFGVWIAAFVEAVKFVWSAITGFFSGLWDGIVNTAKAVWDTLKTWFSGLIEGIKSIWNGLVSFFSGLWDALKEGPSAAIEYIRNAFFGLFENIQNFFFGFIDKIKQGWDTVKGFFSDIGEGIVNFVTGGGEEPAAKPVNDLIVTPEGKFSTHPDDYVMAMKNPGDLVDALIRFLGLQQPQPAYAGAGGSLVGNATSRAAAGSVYNNGGNSQIINADTKITVHVPSGTPAIQAEAISRQVDQAVRDSLTSAISGSRGSIPSPEARRN